MNMNRKWEIFEHDANITGFHNNKTTGKPIGQYLVIMYPKMVSSGGRHDRTARGLWREELCVEECAENGL